MYQETEKDIDAGGAAVIAWMLGAFLIVAIGAVVWFCK